MCFLTHDASQKSGPCGVLRDVLLSDAHHCDRACLRFCELPHAASTHSCWICLSGAHVLLSDAHHCDRACLRFCELPHAASPRGAPPRSCLIYVSGASLHFSLSGGLPPCESRDAPSWGNRVDDPLVQRNGVCPYDRNDACRRDPHFSNLRDCPI